MRSVSFWGKFTSGSRIGASRSDLLKLPNNKCAVRWPHGLVRLTPYLASCDPGSSPGQKYCVVFSFSLPLRCIIVYKGKTGKNLAIDEHPI